MSATITVTLPTQTKVALEILAAKEGVLPEQLIGEAVQEHLFLKQFRSLRERLLSQHPASKELSDQDVFDRVSSGI